MAKKRDEYPVQERRPPTEAEFEAMAERLAEQLRSESEGWSMFKRDADRKKKPEPTSWEHNKPPGIRTRIKERILNVLLPPRRDKT